MMRSEFWYCLEHLTTELQRRHEIKEVHDEESKLLEADEISKISTTKRTREEMLTAIENVVTEFVKNLIDGNPLKFNVDRRNSSKVMRFCPMRGMEMEAHSSKVEVSTGRAQSVGKFVTMMKVLSLCHNLIQMNKFATKRELYYLDVNLFGNQSCVDEALTDLACLFRVPRHTLHVIASSKGSILGSLTFHDENGNFIDCNGSQDGVPVPSHVELIKEFDSDAKYILIVEKEAIFQKLADEDYVKKVGPCIMITGRGFPDMNTRSLVRKLWLQLRLPILALVDADPHGIEIMSTYRFGSMRNPSGAINLLASEKKSYSRLLDALLGWDWSKWWIEKPIAAKKQGDSHKLKGHDNGALSYDANNLTCTPIRWLGIHPTDIERFSIPTSVLIPMSERDYKKGQELTRRPYIKESSDLLTQVENMLASNIKAEIECLDAISTNFLSDVYLPYKIRSGYWI